MIFHSKGRLVSVFEAFGTFLLALGVGCGINDKLVQDQILNACVFFAALGLTGQVSSGYLNPCITLCTKINNRHSSSLSYIIGQFVGAIVASLWLWLGYGKTFPTVTEVDSSEAALKYAANAFVGSAFFSICFLTLTNKYTTHAYKSWQMYLSITVANFIIRKLTADVVLNPVIGLSYELIYAVQSGLWSQLQHVYLLFVPQLLGAALGGIVMLKLYEPLLLNIKYPPSPKNY